MIRLPTLPMSGGCACGQLRYEITGPPIAVYACCCADCQRITASGCSLAMPVMREHLRVTDGEAGTWLRTGGSGAQIPQRFCPRCGVRLWTEPAYAPQTVTVRPGSLDDPSWVRPVAAYWMSSAQPWVSFPAGTLLYDTQPDDFTPVVRAWRAQVGA
ncbi:GFA family protein [Phenylobacterium sp.]|jgi:hypothetical protein|uniref:GFA family protein n=1 Tax=Phenylobacterium sp. TaxID=1871053 RepID=UPI002E37F8EA|nr:GFA family protein [Phenylobacterium sp.]HEX2561826.1 GFA family protein [Phenylobacterium sp.]